MVWVRSPVYFYKRNDTFYFSRAVPSDLRHRFNKKKVEVSLRTKSEAKAAKSAAALSDRLERYWDSLRMEMIYSRELGISVVSDKGSNTNETELSLSDALSLYQRLKGMGKTKLFFEVSNRSIRYLIECVGHDNINGLEPADAGRFRDFLFDRWQPVPRRVFAPHLCPGHSAPKRHSSPILTLPFVSMNYPPSIGYYYTMTLRCHLGRCNQEATANMLGSRAGDRGSGCCV